MNKRNGRQTRTIDCAFSVRSEGDEKRIEGYFSTFTGTYELWPGATESVDPHAFDEALEDDVRCLIDHETRLVLGRNKAGTLDLRIDDKGLWGSVLINEQDQDAMNLYARVQRGDVTQCSFGFDILDETTEDSKDENGNWQVHWTIKKVKLYEVSVCTFPAYKDTEVSARKDEFKNIQKRRMDAWKQQLLNRLHRKDDENA